MKHTLCIDIGGTRIKSAVLPEHPTLEQVRKASPMVIRTRGWLNHSLTKLIDPGHWTSLAPPRKCPDCRTANDIVKPASTIALVA